MAAASLRRVGKGLLLSPIFRKPSLSSGSVILSDVLVPMGVCSILTETSWKIQSAQVYPHGLWQSFAAGIRGYSSFSIASLRRAFSSNVNQLPVITDPDIEGALKDLLAINWDAIPETVVNETKTALSKATEDKAAQEVLANVFRAAEASVEFSGVLVSLRMALDDLCGLSGENVGHLPEHLEDAIRAAYKRYITYLDSFGPDETFLRKKVELELGTKMIHLKMRCSGIGSEWGKAVQRLPNYLLDDCREKSRSAQVSIVSCHYEQSKLTLGSIVKLWSEIAVASLPFLALLDFLGPMWSSGREMSRWELEASLLRAAALASRVEFLWGKE